MIFDKSRYLTNDNGLLFKKIDTKIYDNIIENISINKKNRISNLHNYNIEKIDGKSNLLIMKNPSLHKHKIKFKNSETNHIYKNISMNFNDVMNILIDDNPTITNGIKNKAYFLTNPSKWTRIQKIQIDNNLINIENNKKD